MNYETKHIQHLLEMLQSSEPNQKIAREMIKARLQIKKWETAEKAFFATVDDHALMAYCERMYQNTKHTGIALVRAFLKRIGKPYAETIIEFRTAAEKIEWVTTQNNNLKLPFYPKSEAVNYTSPSGLIITMPIQIERALEFSF